MFGRVSEKQYLRRLLDEERARNLALQEQVLTLSDKPIIPVGARPANVFYMDDARLLEMEVDGELPT